MADTPTPAIPNEVQIDVNDNTTAYNHNISVRITDGRGVINPEEQIGRASCRERV